MTTAKTYDGKDWIKNDWINTNREIYCISQDTDTKLKELKENLRTFKYDNWQCKCVVDNLETIKNKCDELLAKIDNYQALKK